MQRAKALFALVALIAGAIFFADFVERNLAAKTQPGEGAYGVTAGVGD